MILNIFSLAQLRISMGLSRLPRPAVILSLAVAVLTLLSTGNPRARRTDFFEKESVGSNAQKLVSSADVEREIRPIRKSAAFFSALPISFESNQGQADSQVKFLSRGGGYTLLLTEAGAHLQLNGTDGKPVGIGLKLAGANPNPLIQARDSLPGKSHYFSGSDPKGWRTDIPHYAKVHYKEVYPGVDLVYYGHQGQIEYDYIVAAGAEPNIISFELHGAEQLAINDDGDLLIASEAQQIRFHKPHAYQWKNGAATTVAASFSPKGGNRIGFEVADFDPALPLVIDPVLCYSTYLGGSEDDQGHHIAVDALGNMYVTGITYSASFPGAVGAVPPRGLGGGDVFVTKLDASGTRLIYSAFIGGSAADSGKALVIDGSDSVYVSGGTRSTNFPVTDGAFQTALRGSGDAFVLKLNPEGNQLLYSTYLGGSGEDGWEGGGVAVDSAGAAYVTGTTESRDFPIAGGIFQRSSGGGRSDAFVTKVNSVGRLVYSTYLGGFDLDQGRGIAVDSAGSCYVTGKTQSANFPLHNAYQSVTRGVLDDAFLTKFNITGGLILYSTLLGGSGSDVGNAVVVDSSGTAYIAGETDSFDFPTTADVLKREHPGSDTDGFVARFTTTSSRTASLVYCTYLGGSGQDSVSGLAVGSSGSAHVTGATDSVDFPLEKAFQSSLAGGASDAFVAKLNGGATGLIYSTYLGGDGKDSGAAIALGPSANAFVVGTTESGNFPVAGAPQSGRGGGIDGFVARIPPGDGSPASPAVSSGIVLTPDTSTLGVGENLIARFTLTNRGGSFLNLRTLTLVESDPENGVPDFPPLRNLTIEPGDSFTYERILTLTHTGSFTFKVGYQTLDGVWHTDAPAEEGARSEVTIAVENPNSIPAPTNSISVSANPCQITFAASTCMTTVSWNAVNIEGGAQVTVQDIGVGTAPTLFGAGVSGTVDAPWIGGPPHKYKFTLYDVSLGAPRELASVEVTGQESDPLFRGVLQVSNNPCLIPAGASNCTTTISWNTVDAVADAVLYVQDVGAGHPASAVEVGVTGSVEVSWIQGPPHRYIFTLVEVVAPTQTPIAAIEVTAKVENQPGNVSGSISASPNPCVIAGEATTCSTTVSWNTAAYVDDARVVVTDVGASGSPKFFASGKAGSARFETVEGSPHRYRFTLYQVTSSRAIELTSTEVTGGPAASP